ncbi:MAG: hypothetical protein QOG52_1793, partial [Frankiaceae bacterium]|nr:hypothetical protein [Frankiaceae bacterium]
MTATYDDDGTAAYARTGNVPKPATSGGAAVKRAPVSGSAA